jgi:hypothetical protein
MALMFKIQLIFATNWAIKLFLRRKKIPLDLEPIGLSYSASVVKNLARFY